MCGIAGIIGTSAHDHSIIGSMVAAVAHRGPDHQGTWIDDRAEVALGHRRLSIVDLSPAGAQPMLSADGRLVLVFNGEIYNFHELRRELEDRGQAPIGGWRGHSDTEVFLEAIASWGIERAVKAAIGMFAFAVWDKDQRKLTLVRDRFGEKPLYYGWAGTEFVFGSELKALRAHPKFSNPMSRRAVTLFASRTHVPAPHSIYERVFKLLPGCMLELSPLGARYPLDRPLEECDSFPGIRLRPYWSYGEIVGKGLEEPILDETEAVEQLEQALARSVRQQCFADVPVGAFLSGGVDSSLVVALMQGRSSKAVHTFSIGFENCEYDEAHHARAVAARLRTAHEEEYIGEAKALELITALPSIYDEPFADPSQIATHLVSRLARREVDVVLTGDGADELFGGYYHHLIAPRVWELLQSLPTPLRNIVTAALSRVPWQLWNKAAARTAGRKQDHIGPKIQRALRAATRAQSLHEIHCSLAEEWDPGSSPVVAGTAADVRSNSSLPERAPGAVQMMYADCVSYLPDDILCKVDRASMAVGLEARVPFLDHRVAEIAARIPLSMKMRQGRGKLILRKLLHKHVPAGLVDRPKNGFAVPVGEWIKGPLRSWAEDLLEPRALREEGWFEPGLVRSRWQEHLNGGCDSSAALWALLIFQSWLREQRQSSSGSPPFLLSSSSVPLSRGAGAVLA